MRIWPLAVAAVLIKRLSICLISSIFLLSTIGFGEGAEVILIPSPDGSIVVNTNNPESIREELLRPALITTIAYAANLPANQLGRIIIKPQRDPMAVCLRQEGGSTNAYQEIQSELRRCVAERVKGHTLDYFLATVTNRVHPQNVADPDLRMLRKQIPLLPLSFVKKEDSGSYTNFAGSEAGWEISETFTNGQFQTVARTNFFHTNEVVRWINFALIDGEVAWKYQVRYDPRVLPPSLPFRVDSKDYDPKFRQVIAIVETEVKAQMKADGSSRWRFAPGLFEHLKKERLKAKGIEWKTSAELNPGDEGCVKLKELTP